MRELTAVDIVLTKEDSLLKGEARLLEACGNVHGVTLSETAAIMIIAVIQVDIARQKVKKGE